MIRILFTTILLFAISSCGGKIVSYEHTQAMNTLDVALNQMLSGNSRSSLSAYKRSLANFVKSADFCNMSRASMLLFLAKPIDNNSEFVDDALKYAKLGRCDNEEFTATFLKSVVDNDNTSKFDEAKLEEPYRSLYLYRTSGNVDYLIKYIGRGDSSDAIRSMMLREVSTKYLNDSNLDLAEKYINNAVTIDRTHSWSGNLIDDYMILQLIYDSKGIDNSSVVETINLINSSRVK